MPNGTSAHIENSLIHTFPDFEIFIRGVVPWLKPTNEVGAMVLDQNMRTPVGLAGLVLAPYNILKG
jgi:hypothetical protein